MSKIIQNFERITLLLWHKDKFSHYKGLWNYLMAENSEGIKKSSIQQRESAYYALYYTETLRGTPLEIPKILK